MSLWNWPGACNATADRRRAAPVTPGQAHIAKKQPGFRAAVRLLAGILAASAWLAQPAWSAGPQRVVTLAPHITELLFAAGAGQNIIATVASSDYPAKARSIARIGDGIRVNTETLVARKPDLVLAWQPTEAIRSLYPALSTAGIDLQYSQPRSLDDIPREILRFGQQFGTTAVAAHEAAQLQQRINALRNRHAHQAPVRVFIDLGADPLYTLGNDPLLNSVLSVCRGVNVFADAGVAAPLVSAESVLSRRPDALLLTASAPANSERRRAQWKQMNLKAASDGYSFRINPDLLFRPGPRLVDAAEQLCQHLDTVRHARK